MKHGEGLVEPVAVVGVHHLFNHPAETTEDPAIHLKHLVPRESVFCRIKIVEVAQKEPYGVSHLAVRVHQPLKNVLRYPNIVAIVLCSHPQPQNVCPVLLDYLLRRDDVTQAFGHLLAFAIHHEAVGEHLTVWSSVVGGNRGDKGALEPSPVLIASLKVHVAGPLKPFTGLEHSGLAHP